MPRPRKRKSLEVEKWRGGLGDWSGRGRRGGGGGAGAGGGEATAGPSTPVAARPSLRMTDFWGAGASLRDDNGEADPSAALRDDNGWVRDDNGWVRDDNGWDDDGMRAAVPSAPPVEPGTVRLSMESSLAGILASSVTRWRDSASEMVPRTWPSLRARRKRAVSWAVKALVEATPISGPALVRSEEHTSELQSLRH